LLQLSIIIKINVTVTVCDDVQKTLDPSNVKYLSLKVGNVIFISDNLKSPMNVTLTSSVLYSRLRLSQICNLNNIMSSTFEYLEDHRLQ